MKGNCIIFHIYIFLIFFSSVGHEYEFFLKKKLESLNISYQDETILRNSGYDKTPDIKLDIPIGKSKVLFDEALFTRKYFIFVYISAHNLFKILMRSIICPNSLKYRGTLNTIALIIFILFLIN